MLAESPGGLLPLLQLGDQRVPNSSWCRFHHFPPFSTLVSCPSGCIQGPGSHGTARLQSKAMQDPRHPEAAGAGGGCRPPATHCEPVTLHHFIKLLINLFIFLLRLRGQCKHFIPFRAFAFPVLLVQRLCDVGREGGKGGEGGKGAAGVLGKEWGRGWGGGNRTEEKQNNEGFLATEQLLTPYRLNRISRSSLPLRYLSSIKGLWSIESSPSGSGLSQPLKPFFLNV